MVVKCGKRKLDSEYIGRRNAENLVQWLKCEMKYYGMKVVSIE